ncbi:efflux RND transporter periplasmic adaptor subunit [Neptunitalea lumnitzerae]|uniref:RND transporter n=1 Tax=Neptunitalea lumnitzerae TaxID=2965509 RepID=A0ABQ5MMM5_9FLAO|nr:efflux RND transporter periplasmic adaptor subunit [Neptunitalea sp. Y10]GLB50663.1 RND transporter [Neptunitalea sp. Y10]
MSKKSVIILLVIAVVIVAGLVFAKTSGMLGNDENLKEVTVQKIDKLDITETVSATGKIQPEVEVKITSEVSGEIIDLPIVEGQQVAKGDLLVRINPDIYESSLNRTEASLQNMKANQQQAEASLLEAKQNYDRNKILFDKGIISKAEWDQVVSAYMVAKATKESAFYNVKSSAASVSEARDNLKRTTIYAPVSGTISKLDVEVGERVLGTQQMAGTEILRVANLNNMEVEVDVNENDIVKIVVGDSAIVEVDAYLKKEFKGIVTEIANTSNETTSADQVTNFKVKVRILEESYKDLLEGKPEHYSPFRPGMTATVDIITQKKTGIVGVPISAVVMKTDTTSTKKDVFEVAKPDTTGERFECVFVKKGDEAKLKVVKTGIQDDTNIEVVSGLEEGEEVIVGPYNMVSKTLKPGDKVKLEQVKK